MTFGDLIVCSRRFATNCDIVLVPFGDFVVLVAKHEIAASRKTVTLLGSLSHSSVFERSLRVSRFLQRHQLGNLFGQYSESQIKDY